MNYASFRVAEDEPMRKLRNHLRERRGTHGLEEFWHDIAEEKLSNRELAKKYQVSLWDCRCVRSRFISFSRLVFPRAKKQAVILPLAKRA
jgi:hypothetical protein